MITNKEEKINPVRKFDKYLLSNGVKLKGIVRCVYKKAGKAINDYNMIEDKDRILVGVSGGGDSLSLLKVILLRRIYLPIDFKVIACFVDTGFDKEMRPALEEYFKKENVEYIIKQVHLNKEDINCFWCSWSKRKALFQTAKETDSNKIALAHHLDDITETILMNLFFRGEVSSMMPKIELFKGRLAIIRPFAYLEKNDITNFYSKFNFPRAGYQCPYAGNSKRALIKESITRLKKGFPHIKKNIFRALQRQKVKLDYLP